MRPVVMPIASFRCFAVAASLWEGSFGSAAPLGSVQIKCVLKEDRAELLLSLLLGMRATELASLKWIDIYHSNGTVRLVVVAKRAFYRVKDPSLISPPIQTFKSFLLSSIRSIGIPCSSMVKRRYFHPNVDP
jgi:integrase